MKNKADNVIDISDKIDEILDAVDRRLSPRPVVKLEPVEEENISVFESKLGGVPYMPKGTEYPKGKSGFYEGRPLRLLAQLNFEKLPHIENFPEKGILQIFCSDDDSECVFGMDFHDMLNQNGFRVIYYNDIIEDEGQLMSKDDMPDFDDENCDFPFEGEYLLKPEKPEMCPVTISDYRFEKAVLKETEALTGEKIEQFYDIEGIDELYDRRTFEHICIGGYPFMTQYDPRDDEKYADHDILLFQCSSSGDVMWGDCGVANFFIKEEDLKKLDFSKVMFSWDCC